MEAINHTAPLTDDLVNTLRSYSGVDETNPHIEAYMRTLGVFAERGETIAYAMEYLLRMSSHLLRQGVTNVSFSGDTPWTLRGQAIDAQSKLHQDLGEIINWFLIIAPKVT